MSVSYTHLDVYKRQGICTKEFIKILIDEIDLPIIVDAGIGRPSQACEAMAVSYTHLDVYKRQP